MEQYEKVSHFKYFGATPIDFALKNGNSCMVSSLCNINLNNLKDKKCIGMIFNTDPHTGEVNIGFLCLLIKKELIYQIKQSIILIKLHQKNFEQIQKRNHRINV